MLTILLASLLQQPLDFAGLKLEVGAAPKPSFVRGNSRVWEGLVEETLLDKKRTVLVYSLVATTLQGNLAEDAIHATHERNMRSGKLLSMQNFRRIEARIGDRKLTVLTGPAFAPDATKKLTRSFWASFAFVVGSRVFEYNQICLTQQTLDETLQRFRSMIYETEAEPAMTVSGLPSGHAGEYSIEGVPFVVRFNDLPQLDTEVPVDDSFSYAYEATTKPESGAPLTYRLRRLKPGDTRADSELLRTIAAGLAPKEEPLPEPEGGSAHAEFAAGKDRVGFIQFERVGEWAAVLYGTASKASAASLRELTLRRAKP